MTGAALLIILASSTIRRVPTTERVPQGLAMWVARTISGSWMVINARNLVMLMVGAFPDPPDAVLLLGPLFVTIGQATGLDPVQLDPVMVVNRSIGLCTPSVGTTLFISPAIARFGIGETVKVVLPFYIVALCVLMAISVIPALTIYRADLSAQGHSAMGSTSFTSCVSPGRKLAPSRSP
jgi:TRAP-type C4-dicarboxylate transport system permease large subunit